MKQYLGSFTSKYGFGDGDRLPPNVEELWEETWEAVNAALEQAGITDVRAVMCHYNTIHNPYRIALYNRAKEQYVDFTREDVAEAIEQYLT